MLEQWGVDGKVAKLTSAIHTRGGRESCKIGGVIFGAVYAQALKDLRRDLRRLGLMRNEPTVLGQPFWRRASVREQVETCDVPFVDDEALFLEMKSPDQLVEDTEKVLAGVSSTFRRYGLKLNWRPGKSEILVSLRGTGATKVRQFSTSRRESRDVGPTV